MTSTNITRIGDHHERPTTARRPIGPPMLVLAASMTGSSWLGITSRSSADVTADILPGQPPPPAPPPRDVVGVGDGLDVVGVGDGLDVVGVGDGLDVVGVGDGLDVVGVGEPLVLVGVGGGTVKTEGGGGNCKIGSPASAAVMNAVQIEPGYPPPVNVDMYATPFREACPPFFSGLKNMTAVDSCGV